MCRYAVESQVAVFRRVKVLPRQGVASAGSNWSGSGGNEAVEVFDGKGRLAAPRRCQAVTRVHVEQASKSLMWKLTRPVHGESRRCGSLESDQCPCSSTGVMTTACTEGNSSNHGKPCVVAGRCRQPDAREGQAGPRRVTEGFVAPLKPVIPGEGRDLSSRASVGRRKVADDW
jgi:hypothetical protein